MIKQLKFYQMNKLMTLAFFVVFLAGKNYAQTARLQVIHNAADPAAAAVDIYVNGNLTLNDFAFRAATPYLDIPAGVLLNIGVAPATSVSANDTLKNFQVTLMSNETYVAIANGVLNPSSFAPNPDGASTAFTLFLQNQMREMATNMNEVDVRVVHGASDAPGVDVIARNVGTLVNDATYGAITPYLNVPPASYILDITPASGSPFIVSYTTDLTNAAGAAGIVFASGFLDTTLNQNGQAFGLFLALPNGTVLPLPTTSTARLQVIHNAADPAASAVDVYVNGTLTLNDFAFRTATPFIDIPAGVALNIGIAASTSTSVNDTLKNFEVTLTNGETYVAIANGVLNPSNFAPNPDGVNTAFTLFLQNQLRETSVNANEVDLRVVHGSSDAPTVDVVARNVATIVNDASYSAITPYINVPAASYILDITPAAGSPILISYSADLTGIAGQSGVVFASGFLNPAINQNGAPFGLFVALANGTVLPLNTISSARLQVVHNSADPAAALVDVYINGALTLNDLGFRTATPYIDIPAGVNLSIGVAPANSMSVNDTLKNFDLTLANGETYLVVANGVLNPANFVTNPDGANTAFTLFVGNQFRETAVNANEVDLRVVHGSTDAPTVDVLTSGNILVDNASYSNFTSYLNVPAADYILDITPGSNNSVTVASFFAPLTAFAGQSLNIIASGFLSPAQNQNGEAFGLLAVKADGQVILLPNVTSIDEQTSVSIFNVYPNPASTFINIQFIEADGNANVRLTDALGREVINNNYAVSNQTLPLSLTNVRKGIYTLSVELNGKVQYTKVSVK